MKNILIIKIGAIGDVVMALPVVPQIKNQYPNSKITWICGVIVFPMLNSIPEIDEIICINDTKLFNKNIFTSIKEFILLQSNIAFRKFDMILNFHHDARYNLLTLLLRSSLKLRLTRDGVRPQLVPGRSRSFEHVRLFLQSDTNFTGILKFPKDVIDRFIIKRNDLLNLDKPIVILAPGGAKNTLYEQSLRRWPIENYVEVASYLLSRNVNVIITGIKSDEWVLPYFGDLNVIDLLGKLSIVELIALMRESKIVITHDSGPYHLAIFAQRCDVIGLFGPTNPSEFTYGTFYDNKVHILWEGSKILCSPCYFGKFFSTQCKSNICMQMINPEKVIALTKRLLQLEETFPYIHF